MAAITWRNVSGPTGATELNAMAGASRQIGGAFDGLQNALVNYQKEEGRQFDQRKTDNTNAFLNALQSQYRTPEELDAAIKSGAVSQLQQQFGTEINHEQVRGAADNLLASRRQQGLAGMQYNNQVSADQAAPIKSRAQYLASIGDQAGAQAELQKLDPRYQGEAASAVLATNKDHFGLTRLQNQETREQESHGWEGEQHKSRLATDASSRAASAASTATSNLRNSMLRLEHDDLVNAKKAENVYAQFGAAYQEKIAQDKERINAFARNNPSIIPLKKGKADIGSMSPDQIRAANGLLESQGLSLDVFTSGDTDAQEDALRQMQKAGFSPTSLQKLQGKGTYFSTVKPEAIGNDAATAAGAEKQGDLLLKAYEDEAGGTPMTKQQVSDWVSNKLPKSIVDDSFLFKGTNTAQITNVVSEWFKDPKNGVKIGEGPGARTLYPDTNLLMQAINKEVNSNPLWLNDYNIRSVLEEETERFKESIANADKLKQNKEYRQASK